MALEWGALALLVAIETTLLVFITLPGLHGMRRGVIHVARRALQPLMAGIPFSLFLLADVYLKYENRMQCKDNACTQLDREHYGKSIMKTHRNALLGISALVLYWILFRVTALLVDLDRADTHVKRSRQD